MIADITGRVSAVRLDAAVVDIGGVGVLVRATPTTLGSLRPGATARLATSLVVREDSLTLFGFADDEERDVFEVLQTVTGVGPRLALAMLAVLPPDELRHALLAEDLTALMRVPGIGRKGAQRIVLELGDRLGAPAPQAGAGLPADEPAGPGGVDAQVVEALVGLGWASKQAEQAVTAAREAAGTGSAGGSGGTDPADDAAALLRSALRGLARS